MACLAVASSANVAAAASSFTGAGVSSASRNAVVTVKSMISRRSVLGRDFQMVPIRSQAKSNAEVVQRRAVFAAAGAAAFALISSAQAKAVDGPAEQEPKAGSKEAKKKYANICVSQSSASICHDKKPS